jgi:hypothetical protein
MAYQIPVGSLISPFLSQVIFAVVLFYKFILTRDHKPLIPSFEVSKYSRIMTGISYHELSASSKRQGRHSSGERKQLLLVCAVAFAFLLKAFVDAGLFKDVRISDDGIYPGGTFIYKLIEHK